MMQRRRVGLYYQTFTNTNYKALQNLDPHVTDIYLSAVHFGLDEDNQPYIHLNDYPPSHFSSFLEKLESIRPGVRLHVMIGGAGGGLAPLCNDITTYLPLLRGFLACNPRITGINLDIEEYGVKEDNLEYLVDRLKYLYPGFELAMAPIASPCKGKQTKKQLNEFNLQTFLKSNAATCIKTYCVQMYGDFTIEVLRSFCDSYPQIRNSQIMLGTISDEFNTPATLQKAYHKILETYPEVAGIVNWELYDAPRWWPQAVSSSPFEDADDNYYSLLCPLL